MKKMNENEFLKEFQDLLAIDSTTGQFREIHNYMVKKIIVYVIQRAVLSILFRIIGNQIVELFYMLMSN